MPLHAVKDITIAAGASLSAAIEVGEGVLNGIQMPANWTTASMTFQGSADGTTYSNLSSDDGDGTVTEVTLGVTASGYLSALDPTIFAGLNYMKIRSGTAGSPVNQTNAAVVKLIFI